MNNIINSGNESKNWMRFWACPVFCFKYKKYIRILKEALTKIK